MYKTHAMATHHGGKGHPVDRDINLHIEDMEGVNMGPGNNNERTSGSDTTGTFRGSEVHGHPSKLILSSQVNSTYERNK